MPTPIITRAGCYSPSCRGCGELASAKYCKQCATITVMCGFTRAELCDAFDRVKDSDNWKMPVDRTIEGELTAREKDLITAAVIFYAGCEPTFTTEGGLCGAVFTRVQAVGYYSAVGA